MRMLPPTVMEEFNGGFQKLQKEVLCSILGLKEEELSDQYFSMCNLNICDGGLGLHWIPEVSQAAFTASLIDYYQRNDNSFGENIADIGAIGHLKDFQDK